MNWRAIREEKVQKAQVITDKRTKTLQRKAEKVAQTQREENACFELAALEDARAHEDRAEGEYLERGAVNVGYRTRTPGVGAPPTRMAVDTHASGHTNNARASLEHDELEDSSDLDLEDISPTKVRYLSFGF